ncbi:hypothetical protein ACWCP6_24495 [Streptomyces sp. NPDC002004]
MTGRAARVRAALTVLTALALLLTACSTSHDGKDGAGSAGGKADRHAPVLAFVRPRQGAVMLADAHGRTWQGARPGAPVGELRWSPDGSVLAWLDADTSSAEGRRLHLLGIRSGRERRMPCPCQGLGFLGDDVATLSAGGEALLLFPPTGAPKRVALSRHLADYSKVAAGGPDRVAVMAPLPETVAGRGQNELLTVGRDGTVRHALPDHPPVSFISGLESPSQDGLVWTSIDTGGACWNLSDVHFFGYRDAAHRVTRRPHDAVFARTLLAPSYSVSQPAWAGKGITLTFGPAIGCHVAFPARYVSYYLENGTWRYLGSGMLAVGFGADGRAARLTVAGLPRSYNGDGPAPDLVGDLRYTDASGTEKTIARQVSAFAFTPRESGAAPPPKAAAPPRPPTVAQVDDRGGSLPEPVRALAERIRKAAAAGDTATLRSLCAPCDDAWHSRITTADGRRDLARLMLSHPARADDGFVFPGLAVHQCNDAPAQDTSCTADQIQDVALAHIPSDVDLDHQGSLYKTDRGKSVQLRVRPGGTARWVGGYDQ